MRITDQIVEKHGLKSEEYNDIKKILNREPNLELEQVFIMSLKNMVKKKVKQEKYFQKNYQKFGKI